MKIINNYEILDDNVKQTSFYKRNGKKTPFQQTYWRIRCVRCGHIKVRLPRVVKTQGCRQGPCSHNFKDLTGQVFGRLTVIRYIKKPTNQKRWMWLCKCECGRDHLSHHNALVIKGVCECSKCSRKTVGKMVALPNQGAAWNLAYWACQGGAKSRKLKFDLSLDQYKEIVLRNCVYCGGTPSKDCYGVTRNGIDRIDNSVGYIPGNCVPACFFCNRSKGKGTTEAFLDYIDRIATFRGYVKSEEVKN